MLSVVKSIGATVANGALQLVYQDTQGVLRDVYAASFQIWNSDFSVQRYPATPGNKQALDVTSAPGSNRVGVGRYNAIWVSSSETPTSATRYNVRWFITPSNGDAEISFEQEFELVIAPYRGPYYALVSDLRDEGLLSSAVTDVQAQAQIVRASRYAEFYTGRTFVPGYRVLELDGNGAPVLLIEEPIIAIEKVIITFDSIVSVSSQATDLSSLKIYNRHLRQKLVRPDDRDSPKIEFVHGERIVPVQQYGSLFQDRIIWPTGVRNIQVTGMFGYTEPDESYVGHTPDLVREATKLLVFEYGRSMASGGPNTTGPIIRERTRDQEVDYAPLRVTGMTGNRIIDALLAGFKRLPGMGSA